MRVSDTLLSLAALACLSGAACAESIEITSIQADGTLVWTNTCTNGAFTVEWASSLDGPWRSSWAELRDRPVTGTTTNSAPVPLCYRVRWQYVYATDLHISPSNVVLPAGGKISLSASGGSGIYTWQVGDPLLGNLTPTNGTPALYSRGEGGDNSVKLIDSEGHYDYLVVEQP